MKDGESVAGSVIIIMHKYQKYRSKKKEFQSIAALQNNLFDQL